MVPRSTRLIGIACVQYGQSSGQVRPPQTNLMLAQKPALKRKGLLSWPFMYLKQRRAKPMNHIIKPLFVNTTKHLAKGVKIFQIWPFVA